MSGSSITNSPNLLSQPPISCSHSTDNQSKSTDLYINNLLTLANNSTRRLSSFAINKKGEIVTNLFLRLTSIFFAQKKIDQISNAVNQINEAYRGNSLKTVDFFIAVQKYNQSILLRDKGLNVIGDDTVAPVFYKVANINQPEDLAKDTPTTAVERRYGFKFKINRYPTDHVDHAKEMFGIFKTAQLERFYSLIGRVVECVAALFGHKVTFFNQFHFRKHNEQDQEICANTSPLIQGRSTSYWVGHATLCLSIALKSSDTKTIDNFNIITDPIEGDLNAIFYPKQVPESRSLEKMPATNVFLLSHNHLDHYSPAAIKKILLNRPVMLVPKGDGERVKKLAESLGIDTDLIHELNWWDRKEITFTKNEKEFKLQISATPANHWCGHGPLGAHESTFNGYIIHRNEEDGGDIYFAGDTARLNEDHINKLKKHFNIRHVFQPGGPDEVRDLMKSTHQASVDGLLMHTKLLLSKIYNQGMSKKEFKKEAFKLKTIYMHTMTYKLGNLHVDDTKDGVDVIIKSLKEEKCRTLKAYESDVLNEIQKIIRRYRFEGSERLSNQEAAEIFKKTVIVPKLGSCIDFERSKDAQSNMLYW